MSIRFAPAHKIAPQPVARTFVMRQRRAAANDNGPSQHMIRDDEVLRAALCHFAEFGLSSAREARSCAEAAFFAGDRTAYEHWLGLCRILDRRIARQLKRQMQP